MSTTIVVVLAILAGALTGAGVGYVVGASREYSRWLARERRRHGG